MYLFLCFPIFKKVSISSKKRDIPFKYNSNSFILRLQKASINVEYFEKRETHNQSDLYASIFLQEYFDIKN